MRRSSDYVSGVELGAYLGISRAALHKHISHLKKLGYKIEAVPNRGYLLKKAPDVLFDFEIKSLLNAKILGSEVFYFPEISSTQDFCRKLGEEGHPEGAVAVAEVQTKGRGRFGRKWFSPEGGLWFTLLLRPEGISFERLGFLPLIAALAVVKAVEKEAKMATGIKWPNDLMVGKQKFGGILTEVQSELERIHFVLLGIGLNINNKPPSETIYPATSLREATGKKFKRAEILVNFLSLFESFYLSYKKGRVDLLLKEVEQKLMFKGKEVALRSYQELNRVQIVGIDSFGRLIVKRKGKILKLVSGEIEPEGF